MQLLQDIRYSARLLKKRPSSAAIVILTLALGIGANTAVFTVINSLLLRPLEYPNADRIVFVWDSSISDPKIMDSISPHNFTDIGSMNRSFESYFAFQHSTFALTGGGQPEALIGVRVSADFARVLGVAPASGKIFGSFEDKPGQNHVVVISDGLWKRRFGSDPTILGKQIRIDGEMHTVLGVMRPNFRFPAKDTDLWVPLALDLSKSERGSSYLTTVARMKPNVSLQAAAADLRRIAYQLKKQYRNDVGDDFLLTAEPLKMHFFGKVQRPLIILFGAVTFVLFIACVNVANLMLGRSALRFKEMAVRTALGASRAELIRLILTEGVLLALSGGFLGLLIATWGVQLLTTVYPAAIPAAETISMDYHVLGFTFIVSILSGMLFALAPAWHVSLTGLNQNLQEGARSSTGTRSMKIFRATLIVSEISLSLVLLIGAGLLMKSLEKEMNVNPGFEVQNVVTCSIALPKNQYSDPLLQAQFFRKTLASMSNLPGVESAGFATSMPFSGSRGASSFMIDGRSDPNKPDDSEADRHQVSPGYFHTMRIPIQAGRDFTNADDNNSQQVVIINQATARKYWPGQNPLGQHITIGMPNEIALYGKAVSREIVGIIGNVKHEDLKDEFSPEMYIPAWQLPAAGMTLVVRGNTSAESILAGVRQVLQTIDSQVPVRSAKVLKDTVSKSIAPQRFLTTLLMVFAGLALMLALIGIYAVMSFSVTQRIKEIGLRMALGATPANALRLILRQGFVLAAIGIAAGLGLAFVFTRVMSSLLFQVSATDPITIAAVSALLLVVTLGACLIPARRATRVDPMIALRYE
jgi:putative ABC transport system permease protein